jgi:hypothetical protein
MHKYVIFQAESDAEGWEDRKLEHTQALTRNYNPINAPLQPMPRRQISVDSFGGDEAAYKAWLTSQKQPAEV